MTIDLITKIIILLTALVGLYKAATFHKTKNVDKDGNVVENKNHFSDFIELFGIFLFMLAFPAFVFAFMWILGKMPDAINLNKNSIVFVHDVKITNNSSKEELMLFSALEIKDKYSRDKVLQELIEIEISKKSFYSAVRIASYLTDKYTQERELSKIISVLKVDK